jgi:hypothetical protein
VAATVIAVEIVAFQDGVGVAVEGGRFSCGGGLDAYLVGRRDVR